MAAWNPPADVDLGVGKPGKPSHAKAIRDLPTALAERAGGAPWINRCGAFKILGPELSPKHHTPPWIGFPSLLFDWIVPDDVFRIEAILVGGGGLGGAGRWDSLIDESGGGGGGGGGAMVREVIETEPGQVYAVKLGAGGTTYGIHPSVDIGLDDYATGDGARTSFGDLAAAGGKRGKDGDDDAGGAGVGGAGGGAIDTGPPTIVGADGGPGLLEGVPGSLELGGGDGQTFGGCGGASYFGDGAPRKHALGSGETHYSHSSNTVPGSGGGGSSAYGFVVIYAGGWGSNGIVVLRY